MRAVFQLLLIAGTMLMMVSCLKTSSKPGNPMDSTGTGMPGGGTTAPKTTDVYICGADNNKPCYWKNGTEVLVSPGGGSVGGEAYSIVVHDTDVYLAGYVSSATSITGPVYWKNGVVVSLAPRPTVPINGIIPDPGGIYRATGITFSDTSVYVALNQQVSATDFVTTCKYLTIGPSGGGGEYTLPDFTNQATVGSIVVSGTNVYLSGSATKITGGSVTSGYYYTKFPAYFGNVGDGPGEHVLPIPLPLDKGLDFWAGSGTGVGVIGSDVYTSGVVYEMNYNSNDAGEYGILNVYWKNDSMVQLTVNGAPTTGRTSGLSVVGSDVYITGYAFVGAGTESGYWKNGAFTDLVGNGTPNYVAVSPGGDVYVSGIGGMYTYTNSDAVYWKNGVMTTLASGGNSTADQVFVYTH